MTHRRVIAVAAPIGGGKSALVNALSAALGDAASSPAPILRFDDYENATRQPVAQLSQWLADGADFNRLEAPGLADALQALREGRGIAAQPGTFTTASTGASASAAWIVLEMPLGRAWQATAAAIDVLVWVDVPLDIALARRLQELTAGLIQQSSAEARRGLAWMNDYLGHYTGTIHAVLQAQHQVVRPGADLLVDGQRDVGSLCQQVLQHLEQLENLEQTA
ncbi:MAG: hypothetical protein Q7T87_01880 [Polaromonas sp.]|nr:hypothetical protein [Polaromonas sp.]